VEVKFYRNPGLFYDLYHILMMKLNRRAKWLERVANAGYEQKDTEYIDACLKEFAEPNPELAIFFFIKNRRTDCYFLDIYREVLAEQQEDMKLADFTSYLDDTERIRREVCAFYLGKTVDYQNILEVSQTIYQSETIKEAMKFQLLHFFADPTFFTEMLKECLSAYIEKLEAIYSKKEDDLKKSEQAFQMTTLMEGFKSMTGRSAVKEDGEALKISILAVSKNIVFKAAETNWFILGYDHQITLRNELDTKIDIEKFGNAMGDQNRIRIIEYLLKEGELSGGDLAKRLGIALNTASYHLDIMQDAHMLCSRNLGKATYYWLNIRTCEKAILFLNEWIRRVKRRR
jgi:DNA-binding transcriptional ArsR family regulator